MYLAEVGPAVNVVPLLSLGMVWIAVMGFGAGAPTPDQVADMQAEVCAALDAGAADVSSGLIYPPGAYASTEEWIALTRPAAERGGLYVSHIRGEGDRLLASVAEAIRIGQETGAPVQISHFKATGRANWPKAPLALEMID